MYHVQEEHRVDNEFSSWRSEEKQGEQLLPRRPKSSVYTEYMVTLLRYSASQRSLSKGTMQLWRAGGAQSIAVASTEATKQINAAANLFCHSTID